MASEYPAALFYDFKVTCAGNLTNFKADLTRLAALVANPVMEKFVDALRLYVEFASTCLLLRRAELMVMICCLLGFTIQSCG